MELNGKLFGNYQNLSYRRVVKKLNKKPKEWKSFIVVFSRKDDCFILGKNAIEYGYVPIRLINTTEGNRSIKDCVNSWNSGNLIRKIIISRRFRAVILERNNKRFKLLNGHHRFSIVKNLLQNKTIPAVIVNQAVWKS